MTNTLLRAADFIYTVGVNTHIDYTDGGYANILNIANDMAYLGISQIRDQISNGASGSAPLSSYISLAQQGMKFTICLVTGGAITTESLQAQLALVVQLNAAVPGSVIAVEGPNEINNEPISYNAVGGLQGAVNLQQDIYSMVHANPALTNVAVDYFTGYDAGGLGDGPNPATLPGLADFDTQHPYPNNGQPPYIWVNRTQALGNESPATGPAVYTETGYSTNGGTSGAVNADVQARYTLDLVMDDAQSGIAHTDLYQLMDAYQPGSPQGDDGFGLFDPSNMPKEAATAIHNLTAILADTGAPAKSFAPMALNYSVLGLPPTGQSLDIEKSNGASDIVVWAEPAIWNISSGTQIQAPTENVMISLGYTYQNVKVFDPLRSATAIQTLSNVNSMQIGITDHPLIIEINNAIAVPPASFSGDGTTFTSTTPAAVGISVETYGKLTYATTILNAQWNAIKTVQTAPTTWSPAISSDLAYDNFTEAKLDLQAADQVDLNVLVVGAKRGSVTLDNGSDQFCWVAASNGGGASTNIMTIYTGDGNDTINITAAGLSPFDDSHNTGDGSLWNPLYQGGNSVAEIHLGGGTNTVTTTGASSLLLYGGSGYVIVHGGIGADKFFVGAGGGDFTGGGGANIFVFSQLSGHAIIEDFVPNGSKLDFSGITSGSVSVVSTTENGVGGLNVRYGAAGNSVFLSHATKVAASDFIFN